MVLTPHMQCGRDATLYVCMISDGEQTPNLCWLHARIRTLYVSMMDTDTYTDTDTCSVASTKHSDLGKAPKRGAVLLDLPRWRRSSSHPVQVRTRFMGEHTLMAMMYPSRRRTGRNPSRETRTSQTQKEGAGAICNTIQVRGDLSLMALRNARAAASKSARPDAAARPPAGALSELP